MIFTPLVLKDAYLIDLEKHEDERGFFARYYCNKEFKDNGLISNWAQMNNSLSKQKGTIRGLHFQYPPHSEVKLVRCLRGAIWDVIVDIRKDSPTYGKWFGIELNESNRTMIYIPKGFAHGFITLVDNSEILYMVSAEYSKESEGTLKWDDTFHGIKWPIEPSLISDKDSNVEPWNHNKSVII